MVIDANAANGPVNNRSTDDEYHSTINCNAPLARTHSIMVCCTGQIHNCTGYGLEVLKKKKIPPQERECCFVKLCRICQTRTTTETTTILLYRDWKERAVDGKTDQCGVVYIVFASLCVVC